MTEVLKTLRELEINWKKTGAYNVKCRWVAPSSNSSEKASANHCSPDSPMGSVRRVSSGPWIADRHGVLNPANLENKDNESGVECNLVKFEVQVMYLLFSQRPSLL